MLNANDRETLRTLAQKYMEYASLPLQNEKRELWRSLNRLEMQKPMVLIDQLPWNELGVDGFLTCTVTDPYWRGVECSLRRQIYQWEHLPVDMVLTPYILLPRPISNNGYGLVNEVQRLTTETDGVASLSFSDNLKTQEDLERIHLTKVVLNVEAEQSIKETATGLFEGIAPFKLCGVSMHLGIWDWITQAKSITDCYYDLLDRPEFIHAVMEKLTLCVLDAIDQYNRIGGFDNASTLCHCSHTFSDDLPLGENTENCSSKQAWAFGLAQLFSSVSPDITDEFEVPYMKRIFERFGAVYYGCCDRLDDRLEIIDKMPNIRKISCSPWSDRESFAEKLPKKYVMSNKPTPAVLATASFDEQAARDDIRRTLNAAKAHGVALELIMKDVSTVRHDPQRLWRWAEIAAEETASF